MESVSKIVVSAVFHELNLQNYCSTNLYKLFLQIVPLYPYISPLHKPGLETPLISFQYVLGLEYCCDQGTYRFKTF